MLYEDTLTGALYEAPDSQVGDWGYAEDPYGVGEPVFDGLGNPVGFLPFIPKIAALASLAPKVGGLVGGLLRRPNPMAAAAAALPAAAAALPAAAAAIPAAAAAIPAAMSALMMRRPMPPGWMRRPSPYTGLHGRRIYMNCRLYPGPRGLVPVSAAQTPPGAVAPLAPAAPIGRRRGRRRR